MKKLVLMSSLAALLAPAVTAFAEDAKIDFAKQIRPIFAETCYKCHGPEKQKGKLRLDSPDAITKGGGEGASFTKGEPENSPLYIRLVLPKGHDDIMPNEGDPLAREKTDLIGQWIMQGAEFGDWKGDAVAGAPKDAPLPQVAAADAGALEKVRGLGALAMPLAQGTNLLDVGFTSGADKIADAQIATLAPIATQVFELNLANTKITDAGLAPLAPMTNLRRLHLEKTGVTDAGLVHLKGLASLEYLNLYGTAVTDAGLAQLAGLKNLKNVYLWQTKVTAEGAKALKASVPTVNVNRGEEMIAVVAATNAAALAALAPGKPINLKCPVSGKDVNPQFTLAFEGKTVGFCCDMCPKAFQADPKKFADKIKADAPIASAAPGQVDEEGFVREWLVLAPIPLMPGATGATEIDRELVPAEAGLKPKEGDKIKVGDKELAWKTVRANEYFFDVNQVLGAPTNTSGAYAVAYIESAAEKKELKLHMGSNDQGKVFLNGKEILKSAAGRALAKDQDKAENLTLNAGVNVVVFKVINDTNNWQGCLRFTDKENKPVKDVKVKLVP